MVIDQRIAGLKNKAKKANEDQEEIQDEIEAEFARKNLSWFSGNWSPARISYCIEDALRAEFL